MKRSAVAIALTFCGLSTASAGRPDAAALDRFDRTGETVACVNMRQTDITTIDEETLLFKVGPNEFYLNETRGPCNDADSNFTRMEVSLFGSRICSGEIVKIVDQSSGIFQGACSLGEFERLTRKATPDAGAD